MPRVLLLCFIHGFKGSDDTFQKFPDDLKRQVSRDLPDHLVEAVVYPKYETKGELSQCTEKFLEWLKSRVIDLRKAHVANPWPPNDREVGVVLVAHSMGGFVAADTLLLVLKEHHAAGSTVPFPLIQGLLAFDTPYNGLSRSMFVYGAFSNYQKVSSVFNVMTALSAGPAVLGRLAMGRVGAKSAMSAGGGAAARSNPAWKAWQLLAVQTGTVGAIAAGGVAAYVHRRSIMSGISSMRTNVGRQKLADDCQSGVGALGQGLAYINRNNVGESFAWLSDHFTFVGALMKQTELSRRLDHLAALGGVGVHDFYSSLGENGYWSGGYFVPERTFCAVPSEKQPAAAALFERCVVNDGESAIDDEVQAHVNLFRPAKNANYDALTDRAAALVTEWFNSDDDIVDDPKFYSSSAQSAGEEPAAEAAVKVTDGGAEIAVADERLSSAAEPGDVPDDIEPLLQLPDESPVDIAAAASLAEPQDGEDDDNELPAATHTPDDKATYMRHLFDVAQQAGTGIKRLSEWSSSQLPSKMPRIDGLSRTALPTMPKPSIPGLNMFSRKQTSAGDSKAEETAPSENGKSEETAPSENGKSEETAPAENGKSEETAPFENGKSEEPVGEKAG